MSTSVGNYVLLDRIGEGGMGEVWRARHEALGRLVAVKRIRAEALAGPAEQADSVRRRFEREARIAAALRSPHTIQIFDFGVDADGRLYLVMELLDGLDLHTLVERFGAQPEGRVVAILRQVCDALAEAHGMGLLHRDLKPSNLFLSRLGTRVDFVKVLDFGLARGLGTGSADTRLTLAGAVPGSPAWLSPELIRGTDTPTDRADVYALGCVAYWLLTGKAVYDGRSAIEMIVGHLERPVPTLAERGGAASPDLAGLLARCLAKTPDDRPTARELSRLLAGLDRSWDEEAADRWWELHLPAAPPAFPDPAALRDTPPAAPPPPSPPPPRAGSARPGLVGRQEAAYADLRRHFEESRIDLGDFERRLAVARAAREPDAVDQALVGLPAVAVPPAVAAPPALPAVAAPATLPERLDWHTTSAVMSNTRRAGRWDLDPHTRAVSVMGAVELDLREADLLPGCNELRCVAVMGNVTVIVPPDLYVESHGVPILGSFDSTTSRARRPTGDQPWVRISGVAVMGAVEVKVRERPGNERSMGELLEEGAARMKGWIEEVKQGLGPRKRLPAPPDQSLP